MNPLYLLTLAQALAACGSITVVLLGGILGVKLAPSPALATLAAAFLSREAALASENWWPGHVHAGSFLALAGLFLVAAAVLLALPHREPTRSAATDAPVRSVRELWAQPALRVAVLGSMIAWVTMSFIMTATPVSMNSVDGHGFLETTAVIQAHLLGMYVPALFSAQVLRWLGLRRMMLAGCALMAACIGIAGSGHHAVLHYGSGCRP
jgi:Na+/melibiose symporter-like transporter